MNIRLAGGVVPPTGSSLWLAAPAGSRRLPGDQAAPAREAGEGTPPGTPVAVGPAGAPSGHIHEATEALATLVAAGGPLAAGSDADLGHGFRSARLDGGRGDRRDCLLAALTTDPARLGPPPALLAGLFGPRATKRVGAAARDAIADGRWPVLRFAAAASDVLGPEQLERLFALEAPEGVDPFGEGLPSDVAGHLIRLFAGFSGPRRAALLTDLWERAAADRAAALRAERLRNSQDSGRNRDLHTRYKQLDEDETLAVAHRHLGEGARPGQLAQWIMPADLWGMRLKRLLEDSLAVTVLGRVAEDATDIGLAAAIERHWAALGFAGGMPTNKETKFASRRVEGLIAMPARPTVWIRDMVREIRFASNMTPGVLRQAAKRVARARDWGDVLLWAVGDVYYNLPEDEGTRRSATRWGEATLAEWRAVAGHFSPERLTTWRHRRPELLGDPTVDRTPLCEREPEQERVDDFFWFGELADQVARLYGMPAAGITFDGLVPDAIVEPDEHPDPLLPPAGPISAAVSAAAQLAELGAAVPERPRTWAELSDGLFSTASIMDVFTSAFSIPPEIAAVDGTVVPGTDLRVEVARTGRRLAEWGAYMGNCIGGGYYTDEAVAGRTMLLALRDPEGRIVLNAQILPRPGGWHLNEIRARYNQQPDNDQYLRVREWVGRLTPPPVIGDEEPPHRTRRGRKGHRPTPAARTLREAGPELRATLAGIDTEPWVRVAALLPGRSSVMTGAEAVIALRRLTVPTITDLCRRALRSPDGPDLRELWRMSGHRPLKNAVAAFPDRLAPLAEEAPMPGYLRPLARVPEVRTARAADLTSLRVRIALGRLIRDGDPDLARHLTGRPTQPMLCAMALAATAMVPDGVVIVAPGGTEVPGFPATDLANEPWRTARAAAAGLGGVPAETDGLRVPAAWLPRGWPVLWARAVRAD